MSDAEAPQAPAAGETAGALLRRAREAAGLHVANLAVNLKVPVRKLEALEEDRYDLLPDAVFVRALASSVCRTLKIDPQPVLERLPQSSKPRLVQDDDGINAPFRTPGDGPAPGWMEQLSRPVVLGVLALLLAAVVLVFLPGTPGGSEPPPVAATPTQPAAAVAVVPVEPPRPTPVPAAAPAVAPKVAVAPVPAPAPAPASPPPPPAAVTPAPTPAPAPAAPAVATPAPTPAQPAAAVPTAAAARAAASAPWPAGLVAFRTSGTSWIHVTDARGQDVLRRLMGPGDTATAAGAAPLTVIIGSVAATEVQVRGKPFNLAPVSRDNVARFEVR